MKKIELLAKIQKLAALVHGEDLTAYHLTRESIAEIQRALDQLTEEYIASYC